jgi:hypothetical protein
MYQPGYDTHAECQDNGIVHEGDECMKQCQMPDLPGSDGYVGDLEGHAVLFVGGLMYFITAIISSSPKTGSAC